MGWEGHQELRVPKLTIRTIENRAIGALVICVVLIIGAVLTCSFRWGLMHDSPLMHYAAWCITDQGVPYRDLFDFNFPGTYLVHLAVLKILGPSDLAWRVFDLVWLSATAALMFTYCRYFGRLSAGLSVLAIVGFHLTSGPASMGQRDFLLVPFLLAASHGIALFQERRPRAAYLILSGLAVGAAVTVKPTSVCFAALIGLTAIVLAKRKRYPVIRAALIYTIAVATPIGVIALWLWNIGALLPFLKIIFDYTLPLYADLGRTVQERLGQIRRFPTLCATARCGIWALSLSGAGQRMAIPSLSAGWFLVCSGILVGRCHSHRGRPNGAYCPPRHSTAMDSAAG